MQGDVVKLMAKEFLRGSYSMAGEYGIFCRHCRSGHMLDAKEMAGSLKMEDYVVHYPGCVVHEVRKILQEQL